MISARSLTLRRRARAVVEHVTLCLAPGEMTVVVGPNGAGKSSLLKLLSGELRPDQGEVAYDGRPIQGWSPAALARRRAVLPQSSALAFPFTVHEIVRLGASAGGDRAPDDGAVRALALAGLAGFGDRRYEQLSGGEQQRVHFARALAQVPKPGADGQPRALFLDEPTSSLDLRHQIELLTTARRFAREGGLVFAILHDLNLAAEFADRVVVMDAGRVLRVDRPTPDLFATIVDDVYGIAGAATRLPRPGTPYVLPQARIAP